MMQTDKLNSYIFQLARKSPVLGPLVLERKHFFDRALDEELLSEAEYKVKLTEVVKEASCLIGLIEKHQLIIDHVEEAALVSN